MPCPGCPRKYPPVLGDGPIPCDTLFIGERPGLTELKGGRPVIGQSGAEFNRNYLSLAGLDRDGVRITNAVKCFADQNRKPDAKEIASCAGHYVAQEVEECQPSLLVLMGATACSLVHGIELDKEHGIPRHIESTDSQYLGGYSGWAVPMFHPAAGLHDTGMMIPLLEDFERLGRWRRGKWKPPVPDYETDYQIATAMEIRDLRRTQPLLIGVDTEDDCGTAWSVQYSTQKGVGRLVRVGDLGALRELRRLLAESEVVFHNARHDIAVLKQLGIEVPRFRDTMQEAYHLGNLPQGLKALAYRLLGIRMQSWTDLVMPPSRAKAIQCLQEAWNEASEHPERTEKQLKTKTKVVFKPTQLERDIRRILSHAWKPEYDIWKKVDESESIRTAGRLGIPRPSIVHADLGDSVAYACQDADVTLQVAGKLEELRKRAAEKEWRVPKEDWDR